MTKRPTISIGMAHHQDYDGVYFTVQALRLYHPEVMARAELIIVDNSPDSEDSRTVRDFLGWVKGDVAGVKYVAMADRVGSAVAKQRVIDEATGEYIMVMDCHVLVKPGAIGQLLDFYRANPHSRDLHSGPMIYDDLKNCSTHFADVWRGEMWGIWDTDPRGDVSNPACTGEPFEIPAMGMGLFSCRRDAWVGFNERFRGFGAEEWYIHEKFRQAGARCLCLPWLGWVHRFGRPGGVKYPLERWDKVRNYVIGHQELGLPLTRVREHFVDTGLMAQHQWDEILGGAERPAAAPRAAQPRQAQPAGCDSCNQAPPFADVDAWYAHAAANPSDINEHCGTLRAYASKCAVVVELGTRSGISTVALLAGRPGKLVSVDRVRSGEVGWLEKLTPAGTEFSFVLGDSRQVSVPEHDLLFLDTIHTADHVWAELTAHAYKTRRFIALHDTEIYGERGEDGGAGILPAVRRFVRENPQWSVVGHWRNNHGFTVLSCDRADKKALQEP